MGENVEDQLAKDAAQALLKDPKFQHEAQEFAKEKGKQGLVAGLKYGKIGLLAFKSYVESGPTGVQMLGFLAGFFTVFVGVLHLINIFAILFDPFSLILNAYMVILGVVTICLEADTDRLEEMPVLSVFAGRIYKTQEYLSENAKFLTIFGGRGLFYFGVGLVMVARCERIPFCFYFLSGTANIVVGVLYIMLYYQYTPNQARLLQEADTVHAGLTDSPRHFTAAQGAYNTKRDELEKKAQKEMDALLAQANKGDLNQAVEPRPSGFFNMSAKAAWEARKKMLGVSVEEARHLFVVRARVEKVID